MIPIFIMLLAAPVIGSFLGAMAVRIPEERPLLWARSECDSCGRVLSAAELIPVASFVWLRGRCRGCGAAIGAFPLAMELAAIVVVAWAALQTSGAIFFLSCLFGWTLLLLAAIDWRVQLLPDVLTLPLMLAGLVASFVFPLGLWRDHAIGAAAGFAALALVAWLYHRLRKREGLGLGDAKLSAAIGAWIGWQGLPTVVLWGSMLGLLFAIVRSLSGKRLELSDRLPFGAFLAAGGWLVWLYGPLGFAYR
ncbi:MAG TPA: A24 family peptidase [Rhizomicrobium sp.]|jgi:leader peptidase (prepilin peptidase)/N-methyltransferase|nr:A24 family peptidase [Rhizomicrobium sp.]